MTDHTVIESRTFSIPRDNIDTDQIIPASFLTVTDREGLGKACFHHWRFDEDGTEKETHPFSDHRAHQQVLVTGTNFGCGSSREHAPWALLDFGFRAVISSEFADIFRNNSLKNGLLPVTVDEDVIAFLHDHPDHPVKIDIRNRSLFVEGFGKVEFPLDPFSGYCLVHGIDQLDFLMQHSESIREYELRAGE
jgi:3-isopropylmalate/(R)-2-methylmalate dehydratase small subunit